MNQQDFCQQCGQKESCKHVYKSMGSYTDPSILPVVFRGFVLPLVVFIAVLGTCEFLPRGLIAARSARVVTAFVLAILAAFVVVLFVRGTNRQVSKKREDDGRREQR